MAVAGGEALPEPLAEELGAVCRRLVNVYGPTETTVWSTLAHLTTGAPVTIGRPLAATRAYVLDERGTPVPDFIPGELHLGGAGVAHGYRGRPGLTAQRFVPDPWGPPGSRLYRTGDLVRRLPDGRLEFAGRLDDQVKLRGHRIELGEIEARIVEDARVSQAVVVLDGGGGGAGGKGGGQSSPKAEDTTASQAVVTIAPEDGADSVATSGALKITAAQGKLTTVKVADPKGNEVAGEIAADGASWTPERHLAAATKYTVHAVAEDAKGRESAKDTTFTTLVPANTFIGHYTPEDGSTVGVGMPVSINFTRGITE
ncbi:Ig-like domain-containing protein, partial [Streptomyces rubiginosohelvolus]|uniref:Ig-like domain-containing protein n=1 Tax=Streptomyces rubiginosohelvolus TaxID=67362 RepID=UPI0033FB7505